MKLLGLCPSYEPRYTCYSRTCTYRHTHTHTCTLFVSLSGACCHAVVLSCTCRWKSVALRRPWRQWGAIEGEVAIMWLLTANSDKMSVSWVSEVAREHRSLCKLIQASWWPTMVVIELIVRESACCLATWMKFIEEEEGFFRLSFCQWLASFFRQREGSQSWRGLAPEP